MRRGTFYGLELNEFSELTIEPRAILNATVGVQVLDNYRMLVMLGDICRRNANGGGLVRWILQIKLDTVWNRERRESATRD